eukprot:TRINITY_DN1156_c0_g1_i1.p1 TRINITY_DN1156_c0_g1~~TRINITY_DN1156_c0_g1_i1.p1  ORF type:complete len:250 (-),score=7.31 TRINITY_DN1156_c0_g1_i1:108-857(-)
MVLCCVVLCSRLVLWCCRCDVLSCVVGVVSCVTCCSTNTRLRWTTELAGVELSHNNQRILVPSRGRTTVQCDRPLQSETTHFVEILLEKIPSTSEHGFGVATLAYTPGSTSNQVNGWYTSNLGAGLYTSGSVYVLGHLNRDCCQGTQNGVAKSGDKLGMLIDLRTTPTSTSASTSPHTPSIQYFVNGLPLGRVIKMPQWAGSNLASARPPTLYLTCILDSGDDISITYYGPNVPASYVCRSTKKSNLFL